MPDQKTRFGLTLPNRGIIIGATTVDEMFTNAAPESPWLRAMGMKGAFLDPL